MPRLDGAMSVDGKTLAKHDGPLYRIVHVEVGSEQLPALLAYPVWGLLSKGESVMVALPSGEVPCGTVSTDAKSLIDGLDDAAWSIRGGNRDQFSGSIDAARSAVRELQKTVGDDE